MIEEPLSPALIDNQNLGPLHDQMSRDLADFAKSHDFGYWPVSTEAQFNGSDYFDDLHVLAGPEQDQLRVILARHMKQFLAEKGDAGGE